MLLLFSKISGPPFYLSKFIFPIAFLLPVSCLSLPAMTERILIADSGSTKTDWRFIDQMGRIHQFSGQGLNPYFMEKEQMIEILDKELLPLLAPMIGKDSFRGYFYGAGCGSNANCERVTFALLSVFPEAEIQVYSDLLAAAHGLCGHSEGIAAILGTGMNSCLYDGKQIIEQLPSLGYVLGDEGSGAYIGKHLLADYLNRDMPSEMSKRFESRFSLSKDQILHAVYIHLSEHLRYILCGIGGSRF
jgi:glucosamine kinase